MSKRKAKQTEQNIDTDIGIAMKQSYATEERIAQGDEARAKLSAEQLDHLRSLNGNKSSMIRYLSSEGIANSEIGRCLVIRPQHVRNVLETPLKRSK